MTDTLRASDVGRYVYCARAWWLQRVQGRAPENREALELGEVRHRDHGDAVAMGRRYGAWARALLLLGLLLAVILLLSWGRG